MINTVFGTKIDQTQGFLENGKRIPLSRIHVGENVVAQIKTGETDGYNAIQIAFGKKNKITKSVAGHIKKAGIKKTPRFFKEARLDDKAEVKVGEEINIQETLKPGDIVMVTGTSKGKGYAGVVKRHGFAGGPRTHGQSDRERAPGAIGQSATPSRVMKGKKMAGRMGNEQVTVKNLVVIDIDGDTILVKGLIPGTRGSTIKIVKMGEAKNFTPLHKNATDEKEESSEAEGSEKEVQGEEKETKGENTDSQEAAEAKSDKVEKGETVKAEERNEEKVSEEKAKDEKDDEKKKIVEKEEK